MPMMGEKVAGCPAPYPLPLLPEIRKFNWVSLDRIGRSGSFFLVRPPGLAKVDFNGQSFKIGIPWHLFGAQLKFRQGIIMSRTGLWFLDKRPENIQARTYIAPLPNMGSTGVICYGRFRPYSKTTVYKYVRSLADRFWMSPFNLDMWAGNCPFGSDFSSECMKAWQEATLAGDVIRFRPSMRKTIEMSTREIRWDYDRPTTFEFRPPKQEEGTSP
jgi:hypothetical protein